MVKVLIDKITHRAADLKDHRYDGATPTCAVKVSARIEKEYPNNAAELKARPGIIARKEIEKGQWER